MGWKDRVRIVYGAVTDTALDVTASVLEVSGTTACLAGGAGFAISQIINKTFNASYAGVISAQGNVSIIGTLDGEFKSNHTLPVILNTQGDGEGTYNLIDYVDPRTLQLAGTICVGIGITLKAFSTNIKKWQEYRYDARNNNSHDGKSLAKPSSNELKTVNAASLCNSFVLFTGSYAMVSCIAYYTKYLNSDLTYPFNSQQQINGLYYDGPSMKNTYLVDVVLEPQQLWFDMPLLENLSFLLDMALDGKANLTYGGGIFFNASAPKPMPPVAALVVSATTGFSAYLLGNFFTRKERFMRDERTANTAVYSSIDEDSITPARP